MRANRISRARSFGRMSINKPRAITLISVLLFFCFLSANAYGQLGSAGTGGAAGKTTKTKKTTAKKPAKTKTAKKPVNNNDTYSEPTYEYGLEDVIGVWRAVVTEQGQTYQIDVAYSREGTTAYLVRDTQGRSLTLNGGWSYSNGILYEQLSDGTKARGSIEWVDKDNIIVTIIDNGDPAYRGVKRRYTRIG